VAVAQLDEEPIDQEPLAWSPWIIGLAHAHQSRSDVSADTRRLAAIMFTDLVAFTKLAQRDEEAALRLRAEHQSLLRPLFVTHGGREVKTTGDGFLVEFPSAVESVRCAVEIQEAAARRNSLATSTERIVIRVGIHVGDIVGDGDDIVGDAVNVASRIEPLAEPGGICVSGSVFEHVRNKLQLPLEKIGPRDLKNVEFPVDIYRIVLSGESARARPKPVDDASNFRLAVLPLASMSPDPNDDYFADGLTDELITQTARIPDLRVTARTSVVQFKNSTKSLREVAQDLGVHLVLEGSVRKAGNRVRITVKLVDARTEDQLWSSTYDRPLDDIFAIQDDIASQVASSIAAHVSRRRGEASPPLVQGPLETKDMDAYIAFLHGRKLLSEKVSEETVRQALAFFEDAVQRDPRFARARVGIADCLLWLRGEGVWSLADSSRRARDELTKALGQNDALAEGHSVLAGMLLGEDDIIGAEREARRATELNPSLSDPYRWLAQIAAGDAKIDEAVRLLEIAQKVDPLDVNVIAFLGRAYVYAGRDADAIAHWERTKALIPFRTNAHLTEYYLGRGDFVLAKATLSEMERLRPDSVWTETYRGMLAARLGRPEEARKSVGLLESRSTTGESTAFFAGFVYYALGEMDAFAACIERSFRTHDLPLMELMYSRLFEAARNDPRIIELIRRQSALRTKPD
jgi:adenylate cyclase